MEILNKLFLVCYYFCFYLDEDEDEIYEEQSVEQVK